MTQKKSFNRLKKDALHIHGGLQNISKKFNFETDHWPAQKRNTAENENKFDKQVVKNKTELEILQNRDLIMKKLLTNKKEYLQFYNNVFKDTK
jgi:hypothetical protein